MNNFICIFGLVSIILIFMYIYMNKKEIKETLQNMDSIGYIDYDDENSDNNFQKKIKNKEDLDLSGILQDAYYNDTLFKSYEDVEGTLYNDNEIVKDVKYFNNVSHILMNYKLKNMINLNDENKYEINYKY